MIRNQDLLSRLALVILAVWLGLTLFTDFVVIRTAFEITGDFFKAGDLGIALFSKLNNFEIIFGSFILIDSLFAVRKSKAEKTFSLIFSLILLSIALTYFALLTPKITHLTELWKEAERLGAISLEGIPDVQAEHQFYHRLYIGLDSLKMTILLILLSLKIFRREA